MEGQASLLFAIPGTSISRAAAARIKIMSGMLFVLMEEATTRSKRRRVCSFGPNAAAFAAFSHEYTSRLLPALLGAVDGSVDAAKKERIVRFEVDMALALSTCREFGWGRALKRELEEAKCGSRFALGGQLGALGAPPSIPRPIAPAGEKSRRRGRTTKRRRGAAARGGEELSCRIRTLRRILPGGREMSVLELLTEVGSYVVCLRLQVDVLRSLVES